ncbi:ribosome maturation factor RimM [Phycicoccus endophyticus]|uniref:Ribosome maturation factor RimM n=1 Tax=Phycicoccus endophyticus TaxID=1690220 RepID=A0A7G9QY84_9MICO|nr:ribosome maturation factor RimM [Phycicoccus endophyticus]NHI19198.1 ribosome maturation factor RimM [Phycicoccus endophyticus]QNN48309.1 ribosome maturation factor RimM [Phycicoccus endophyticus]GGL40906.1 ribosome maturation factor RimM [Phycicoccus endophyticus]
MSEPVLVARIGKPHGLRGEATVRLHTDDPERRLEVGAVLSTQADPGSGVPRELTVRSTRVHRGIWLVAFEEVPDRTGAEGLRGTRLLADADPPSDGADDEDTFTEDQLRGLAVLDGEGRHLGEVTGLELGAAQDRLVVRLEDGRVGRVPFVTALVPEVDLAAGRVVLLAPGGLFDLEG